MTAQAIGSQMFVKLSGWMDLPPGAFENAQAVEKWQGIHKSLLDDRAFHHPQKSSRFTFEWSRS